MSIGLLGLAMPSLAWAGAWTLPAGRLWVKQGGSFWRTDRKFASSLDTQLTFADRGPVKRGERIPFDPSTGGTLVAVASTTELALGLLHWLQLGLKVPLIWSDFETAPDTVDANFGVGDIQLAGQLSQRLAQWVLSGRVVFKLPTGDFDRLVFSQPIAEGQLDIWLFARLGRSFFPWGYANVDIGYLFRFENSSNQREPGDEVRFAVEGGVHLPYHLGLKAVVDGWIGFEGSGREFGVVQTLPRRRLYSLWAGLFYQPLPQLTLALDTRFLLAGEDLPAGLQFYLSGAYEFQLW